MNERRMSGKQQVVGGFDLNSFVQGAEPELVEGRDDPKPVKAPVARTPKPSKVVEKKPLLTERAQIKLTTEEMAKLKDKAGMVPLSVFLRKHLQDSGMI